MRVLTNSERCERDFYLGTLGSLRLHREVKLAMYRDRRERIVVSSDAIDSQCYEG